MIVIGIDPGLSGAIAAICLRRGFLSVADLPVCSNGLDKAKTTRWLDVRALDALLRDWSGKFDFSGEHVQAVMERPIPMPSQQVWTTASSFDMQGAIRAVFQVRNRPLELITPNAWKRFYRLGKDKGEARATAQRLYPDAPLTRVKDHNRAEAILIARFGPRTMA